MSLSSGERRKQFWFGIVFILAGLIPAGMVAVSVRDWQRSRSWVEAQAEIISADLKSNTTTGPHGRTGSSLKLVVEYRYQLPFAEETFQSHGVSPFNRIEFFDSDTRDESARLREAQRDGETVTCYVNPDNPSEAFLNRDFRWGAFLLPSAVALLFCGVGVLIVRSARDPNYEPPPSRMR